MAELTARLARLRVPVGFAVGILVLALAHPTWPSLAAGTIVALAGEAIRIWAAGHLEKSREVTRSGPYRWLRHPLYVGSAVMGAGVVIAASSVVIAGIVCGHLPAVQLAEGVAQPGVPGGDGCGGDLRHPGAESAPAPPSLNSNPESPNSNAECGSIPVTVCLP